MYIVNQPIESSIPGQIVDAENQPITTLITGDFTVILLDPTGADRSSIVEIVHVGSGMYLIRFTPDASGMWRLTVTQSLYGVEAFDQFEVEPTAAISEFSALTDASAVSALLAIQAELYSTDQIDYAVGYACDAVTEYCKRDFVLTSATGEVYEGDGTDELILDNYPIVSVDSVLIDGEAVTDYELIESEGTLYREYGWPRGRRNIRVDYTHGYSAIPRVIHAVATKLAIDFLRFVDKLPLASERIGDYSYQLDEHGVNLVEHYERELAPFRKLV